MSRSPRLAGLVLLAGLAALHGCSSDDDQPIAPSEPRAQDARTFSADEAAVKATLVTSDPATLKGNGALLPIAGIDTDRWAGILGTGADSAAYQVEVPRNWNGKLVMYAHGYRGEGSNLTVSAPSIRRYLVSQGYAWAASSYSRNYYDVRAGVEDTNALALAFNSIAAQNGRTLAKPERVYITGHSMGGHVTGAAIDEENIRDANHKVALRRRGADVRRARRHRAVRVLRRLPGGRAAARRPAGDDLAGAGLRHHRRPGGAQRDLGRVPLGQHPRRAHLARRREAQADRQELHRRRAAELRHRLRAAERQHADGLGHLRARRQGQRHPRHRRPRHHEVRLPARQRSGGERRGEGLQRRRLPLKGDPEANRRRNDGLRWIPKTNADFNIPVVSLHTLGDMYVPFSMEQIFKRRADALGTSGKLVQRAARGISHCDFTLAEQEEAFADMVRWEQQGIKPLGDDVLTPAVVADPAYGCKFSRAPRADDSAALQASRATLVPACPAGSASANY